MKNLISGMLAVIFFIILAFGGVLIWDIAENDGKITNSLFETEIENDDVNEDNVKPDLPDEESTAFLTSNLLFIFKTDTVFNGVNCATIENEATAQQSIVYDYIAYQRENAIDGYNPTLYSLRWNSPTNDVSTFTVGSYLRIDGDVRILLRAVPGNSTVPYSFDIFYGGTRYRFIDNSIKTLFNDYLNCGYINFDFGAVMYNDVAYYGFRFSTENEEITYFSDNSGTLKNETLMFECASSNSTSGQTTSLYSLLSSLETTGVEMTNSYQGVGAATMINYATTESATYLSAENTSTWFKNKVIDLI